MVARLEDPISVERRSIVEALAGKVAVITGATSGSGLTRLCRTFSLGPLTFPGWCWTRASHGGISDGLPRGR